MDPDPCHRNREDSMSPLRSLCSSIMPPPTYPCRHNVVAKEDFESLASGTLEKATLHSSEYSQSHTVASSPLDAIPSNIYVRFPRLSTTTENSTPDLSTEEVTSTRLSIDEYDLVRLPQSMASSAQADQKEQNLNSVLHRAISTPNLSLRRMKERLRRAPSSTLSGKTLRQEATLKWEGQTHCSFDHISTIDASRTSPFIQESPGSSTPQENRILRFRRNSKELLTRTYSRLSTLAERKAEDEPCICQTRREPSLEGPTKRLQPLSFGALEAFDDFMDSSVTSFNSYHTAPDRLSRQISGSFTGPPLAAQDRSLPRSTSSRIMLSESIDELRSHTFLTATHRTFSFSGTFPGQASRANLDQGPSQAPVASAVTLHDVEDVRSLTQLRQEPLFVDMPNGHQPSFIFPLLLEESSASIVPHALRNPKSRSYRNLRQQQALPLLIRSTSMHEGLESGNYQRKVPLYTPLRIIRPRGTPPSFPYRMSSLANAHAAIQPGDGADDKLVEAEDQSSTNSLSNASEWSTKEDRAGGQDLDAPSLRSEDPSVESANPSSRWKGQRLLAVVKKAILRRPAVKTIRTSEVPSKAETEKTNHKEPFRRTCGYYARRMKQKLRATHLQDAIAKEEV